MAKLTFAATEKINLKTHPDFNEMWVQDRIAENPQIIGLGELELLDRERKQHKSGRLDLLLADFENNARYEVELQLGQTDESHIIRCIEYWDVEKRRYPQYDHCGVLIAEDITSRFLNVLGLFNGHIPLIIIQLTSLKVEKIIGVYDNNGALEKINELEYIKGFIYANIYTTNRIIKIDPKSGRVTGDLNLTSLDTNAKAKNSASLELNGIAYDSDTDKIYVTGKLWPTIYEIKFNH